MDTPLCGKGKFLTNVEYQGKSGTEEFVVVQGRRVPLLGANAAIKLGILKTGSSSCVDTANTLSKNRGFEHLMKK